MNRTTIDEHQRHLQPDEPPARRGPRQGSGAGREGHRFDVARLREVGRNLATQVGDETRKRPYAAIGAAAGVGFVAGSLFGSRLGQVLLAAGLGYVARNFLDGSPVVERLQDNIEKLANERMKG